MILQAWSINVADVNIQLLKFRTLNCCPLDDVFVLHFVHTQDRNEYADVQKLEGECLLKAARDTIGRNEFIKVLAKCDKGFCAYLGDTIIDHNAKQNIQNTHNDADALFQMKTVSIIFRNIFI